MNKKDKDITVTVTRRDGSQVTVPGTNHYEEGGNLVVEGNGKNREVFNKDQIDRYSVKEDGEGCGPAIGCLLFIGAIIFLIYNCGGH